MLFFFILQKTFVIYSDAPILIGSKMAFGMKQFMWIVGDMQLNNLGSPHYFILYYTLPGNVDHLGIPGCF